MPDDRLDDGIRLIGDALPYADGAEDQLLEVFRGATDRTSTSDELVEGIVDWPTRYHLTRLRANLLRALRLPAGARVLDVGAGTGALSRYLGEQGLQVVALEGSLARARAARARCADLENVEVVCGPLTEFDDRRGFDLVVVCGVLEYSHAVIGGDSSAEAFLAKVRSLCKEDGSLVLAIENRLGLKYLLGYGEDHLGTAWVGIEGYPANPGVRTWSRHELRAMLGGAGFEVQRWLFPFPDYKLPTMVLTEAAYAQLDAERFVDQIVRQPVLDYALPPTMLTDDRAAHAAFVAGGLGAEVANSLLVVASAAGATESEVRPDALVEPGVLAWRFGDERAARWLRTTTIRDVAGTRVVHQARFDGSTGEGATVDAPGGWLHQQLVPEAPYHLGPTLEQQVLRACRDHDLDTVAAVLRRWCAHLAALETDVPDDLEPHPFLSASARAVLPGHLLDTSLDNFVDTDDGLEFVDPEWVARGGVDADLVMVRGLFSLARRLIALGAAQPFDARLTIDALALDFGAMCGVPVDGDLLDRWRTAEGQLQFVVNGQDATESTAEHAEIGQMSRADLGVSRHLPFTRLRTMAEELRRQLDERDATIVELRQDVHRVVLHGDRVADERDSAIAERDVAWAEIGRLQGERDVLASELAAHVKALDDIVSSTPYRAMMRAKREADRAKKLLPGSSSDQTPPPDAPA